MRTTTTTNGNWSSCLSSRRTQNSTTQRQETLARTKLNRWYADGVLDSEVVQRVILRDWNTELDGVSFQSIYSVLQKRAQHSVTKAANTYKTLSAISATNGSYTSFATKSLSPLRIYKKDQAMQNAKNGMQKALSSIMSSICQDPVVNGADRITVPSVAQSCLAETDEKSLHQLKDYLQDVLRNNKDLKDVGDAFPSHEGEIFLHQVTRYRHDRGLAKELQNLHDLWEGAEKTITEKYASDMAQMLLPILRDTAASHNRACTRNKSKSVA